MGSINHLFKFIPNAASLTYKLRPLLKEENEKKKIRLPVKKFDWDNQHSVAFEEIKKAVANIATTNYYNPSRETRVMFYASHSGLEKNEWAPIAFASRYLNTQEKNTNELD